MTQFKAFYNLQYARIMGIETRLKAQGSIDRVSGSLGQLARTVEPTATYPERTVMDIMIANLTRQLAEQLDMSSIDPNKKKEILNVIVGRALRQGVPHDSAKLFKKGLPGGTCNETGCDNPSEIPSRTCYEHRSNLFVHSDIELYIQNHGIKPLAYIFKNQSSYDEQTYGTNGPDPIIVETELFTGSRHEYESEWNRLFNAPDRKNIAEPWRSKLGLYIVYTDAVVDSHGNEIRPRGYVVFVIAYARYIAGGILGSFFIKEDGPTGSRSAYLAGFNEIKTEVSDQSAEDRVITEVVHTFMLIDDKKYKNREPEFNFISKHGLNYFFVTHSSASKSSKNNIPGNNQSRASCGRVWSRYLMHELKSNRAQRTLVRIALGMLHKAHGITSSGDNSNEPTPAHDQQTELMNAIESAKNYEANQNLENTMERMNLIAQQSEFDGQGYNDEHYNDGHYDDNQGEF
ncbi:hypothetical protein HDU86_000575 [Geranomyces michiganensis]|nr:hypothetical protein HDU86_000575 [Geranomyces michiganensis]